MIQGLRSVHFHFVPSGSPCEYSDIKTASEIWRVRAEFAILTTLTENRSPPGGCSGWAWALWVSIWLPGSWFLASSKCSSILSLRLLAVSPRYSLGLPFLGRFYNLFCIQQTSSCILPPCVPGCSRDMTLCHIYQRPKGYSSQVGVSGVPLTSPPSSWWTP